MRPRRELVLGLLLASPTARAQVADDAVRVFLLAEEVEAAVADGSPILQLEGLGWAGGDVDRAWVRLESDRLPELSSGEVELFYGRLVAPFWDLLVGVRVDEAEEQARPMLAVGVQGLAPYRFEVAPTVYVGPRGDVAARLEVSQDWLLTQRLILEPELELDLEIEAVGLEVAARLRYEVVREVAPYVGVGWRLDDGRGSTALLIGVRTWR